MNTQQNENCQPGGISNFRQVSTACQNLWQQLKETVHRNLAAEYSGRLDHRKLQQAVNEADALAAHTPYPALFLPALAEEKAHAIANWQARQNQLLRRSESFALAA